MRFAKQTRAGNWRAVHADRDVLLSRRCKAGFHADADYRLPDSDALTRSGIR